jgi:hypothetical protein
MSQRVGILIEEQVNAISCRTIPLLELRSIEPFRERDLRFFHLKNPPLFLINMRCIYHYSF